MNICLTEKADLSHVAQAREANDRFRRTLTRGHVVLTAGIVALGAEAQSRLLEAVRAFDDFDAEDPWDVHDIGDLEIDLEAPGGPRTCTLVFFRIDRVERSPGVPARCHGADGGGDRVLTLMLASEW